MKFNFMQRGSQSVLPLCSRPMSETELSECQGGGLPASFWFAVASLIVSNWQDVQEGFSDGINGKSPRYAN